MRTLFVFCAVLTLSAIACKKNQEETNNPYTLSFHAEFGGKQASLEDIYNMGVPDVQLTRFNLFLSDLILVKSDGSEVLLSEVELLDFTSPNDNTAIMEPIQFNFSIPSGDYKALKLGYGVKPSLNSKRPSLYASTHPLSKAAGEYWESWKSYIFMKIEGKGDTDNDPDPEVNLVYHCGSDAVYRTTEKAINLSVKNGSAVGTNIVFDIKQLFFTDNEWYDIEGAPRTSDDSKDVKVATVLMDRMAGATSVR